MENGNSIQKIDANCEFLPQEEILLRTRCHPFMCIAPVIGVFLFSILLFALSYFVLNLTASIPLFIATTLLTLAFTINLIAKHIIDWHCHFYVLTTKRIMEVDYKPLFARHINNVIINQVKSTEIDVETKGVVNHILNMGNVIVTFDRPTRQDEFYLANIKNPRLIGLMLADVLDVAKPKETFSPLWFKPKNKENTFRTFRTTEESFSPQSFSAA